MGLELTFGQVEAVLAMMNNIASDKRPAFTARLKHLRSNGLPRGNRPGRGKAGSFGFGQLMQMIIALELIQSGIPPALAAKIVLGNWYSLRITVLLATYNQTELRRLEPPAMESEWLWVLTPETLRDLSDAGGGKFDHYEAIATIGMSDIGAHIEAGQAVGVIGEARRKLILNGTAITRAAILLIAFHFGFATVEDLRGDVQAEVTREQQALDEAIANLPKGGQWSTAVEAAIDMMNLRPIFPWSEDQLADAETVIRQITAQMATALVAGSDPEALAGVYVTQDVYDGLIELGLCELSAGQIMLTERGTVVASEIKRALEETEPDFEIAQIGMIEKAMGLVIDRMTDPDRSEFDDKMDMDARVRAKALIYKMDAQDLSALLHFENEDEALTQEEVKQLQVLGLVESDPDRGHILNRLGKVAKAALMMDEPLRRTAEDFMRQATTINAPTDSSKDADRALGEAILKTYDRLQSKKDGCDGDR